MSNWFKDKKWSKKIKKKLEIINLQNLDKKIKDLAKINRIRNEKRRKDWRVEASKEFNKLYKEKLFIAGLMTYDGEGDRVAENGLVRMGNTNPKMINTFVGFINKFSDVPEDKIKAFLLLYPDHIEDRCLDYWASGVNISKKKFTKTQFIKGRHKTKRLKYGVCYVNVSSRELKEKILVWIDLCYNKLLNKRV